MQLQVRLEDFGHWHELGLGLGLVTWVSKDENRKMRVVIVCHSSSVHQQRAVLTFTKSNHFCVVLYQYIIHFSVLSKLPYIYLKMYSDFYVFSFCFTFHSEIFFHFLSHSNIVHAFILLLFIIIGQHLISLPAVLHRLNKAEYNWC